MEKKEKTGSTKVAQEESSEYSPIYLAFQGNDWQEQCAILTTAIYQAKNNNQKLYIMVQSGGSGLPPACPAGFPNCHG